LVEIKTSKDAEKFIRKWLTDNGHSIEELSDENSTFNFKIDYPAGQVLRQQVVQPKRIKDLVLAVNPIIITDEYLDGLKKMDKDKRDAFMNQLRKEFMLRENQFEFKFDSDGVLTNVIFTYPIYFDGLTKDSLFRALNTNHKTRLYLYLLLREALRQQGSK
jgi:hypothetical protein